MHLIYIRDCKDYVYGRGLNYGTHQIAERNIVLTKYPLNDKRKGYNIPFTTQIHFLNTRIKKECMAQFVADLYRPVNLNPEPNNMTLYKVIKSDTCISGEDGRKLSELESVGVTFKLAVWLFKWINKKKTTSIILFIIGLLTLQLWMWLLIPIIIFNPLKPVPMADKPTQDFYDRNWCYTYIIGCLNDPVERMKDKETGEEYVQEDVL